MGFFAWLGSLVDQLFEWLGRAVAYFINALANALEKIWETTVATALIAVFGVVEILYVIFVAGEVLGQTIMEIWDPRYVNTKPSKVFKIEQAPQNSPLPTKRSDAQILVLRDSCVVN